MSSNALAGKRKKEPVDPSTAMPWMKKVDNMVRKEKRAANPHLRLTQQEEAAPAVETTSTRRKAEEQVEDMLKRLDYIRKTSGVGLKWQNIGPEKPNRGTEMKNDKLALALTRKTQFTQAEWTAFAFQKLDQDHYIRVGEDYFQPVGLAAKEAGGADTGGAESSARGRSVSGAVAIFGGTEAMPVEAAAVIEATAATDELDNTPVTLCGMQLVLHGDAPPREQHMHGARPEKPLPPHQLRYMMAEMEKGTDAETVAKKQALERREAEERKNRPITVSASYEAAPTYSTWVAEKDFWAEQGSDLKNPPSKLDKERERKNAAARLHNKQMRKQNLQQAADDAKFRFGPSSFEKENDRKRKEMLSSTAFEQEQARGLSMFLRRTPRNMFINLLAAAAQAFIIFTVLLGKDGTLEKEPVLPAPQSVIIFAFAGVYGSVVNLFCLITVYVVIKVKGVKAQSLPTVCKAVVACQYLSKTAQAYSLVSFILYLGKFFDRVTDEIEDGDSGSMLMAILQIVCGIIVLPLLVYVFVAAHSLCNNELALFVSRAALMKSYATNIEVHQVISGVALLAFSTTFANDLDKVDNDSILGYMYLMSIFCAVACLNFSYAHYRVTHHLRGFERRQESLAQDKENCIAKMRLQALDKTPCMVAHAPDKPSIMGLRGVVVGNGVDNSGKAIGRPLT